MEIKNIILFICFGVAILYLIYYGFIRKEDGIVQRVKTYGSKYYIRTKVWVKGELIYSWIDETEDEKEFHRIKKLRKAQGETKHYTFKLS